MAHITLAPDYYLSHFLHFLQDIRIRYAAVLQPEHVEFMTDFLQLSTTSQKLWLRMLNRKGQVFALADLKYDEIGDVDSAVRELFAAQFVAEPNSPADWQDWLMRANKERLWQLLQNLASPTLASTGANLLSESKPIADLKQLGLKQSSSKSALQQAVVELNLLSTRALLQLEPMIAMRRLDPLQYLLFLYFGRFEQNLQAFTLRDLGVIKTGGLKTSYQARYLDAATAHHAYFYVRLQAQWRERAPKKGQSRDLTDLQNYWQQMPTWPEPLDEKTHQKRERLLYEFGLAAERLKEFTLAADFYRASASFPASERLVRIYQQTQQQDLLVAQLQQMIDNPSCDDELWFARDVAARHGKERRVTDLTLWLQQAQTLRLDEMYLGNTEQGAVAYYQAQGMQAWHVENELWLALFGLLFWQELFEAETSAIFNEFERRPRNLTSPDFYQTHQAAIEAKLSLLVQQPAKCLQLLLKNLAAHHGKFNAIFRWHSELTAWLTPLLQLAPADGLASLLRLMAKDFRHHCSGFPDLMVVSEQGLQFIELKAAGDSLRRHQLSRLRTMQALGFAVSLQKVQWWIDPARIYAVVDVETTGGTADKDRMTEIAIVKVQNGQIIDTFSTLVNPMRTIPAFITRLTGISQAMVATAPTFAEIASTVDNFLKGCLFVAHNAKFDYGFVRAELERAGIEFSSPQLCTVVAARRYFPKLSAYGLAALCQHFAIPLNNHHRALADAEATAQLLMLINAKRLAEFDDTQVQPSNDEE